ncbi:transmembrane prolyl 4-hydroxylase-like, partial [Saccoglossus kowalevskii]|uniref:Transmembrane prolyl 4-hydroxylase-like n=1 Tax=Saccoglossus kowalevskii TaxID=10224 RepID=A0ABM0MQX5_SACKO
MRITLEDGYDVYFDDDDLRQMYEELKLDQNKDDYITVNEMRTVTPAAFSEFVDKWTDARPHLKSRLSEQAWIFPDTVNDEVVDNLKERMLTVLQLPRPLIDKYDAIQVVKYGIGGHYNAHIDSGVDTGEDNSLTCCHLKLARNCRICRYVTFMVYLNDVEKGGETAFPVANNSTYDVEALRHGKKLNLNKYCNKSNLMIKPKKGKAVIWYNHFINEQTGWFGHTDQLTWHGGCPVVKGTKWILNRWINATPDRKLDLKPEY